MKITNKFKHTLKTTGLKFKEGKVINDNLVVRLYSTKDSKAILGFDNKFYNEEFLLTNVSLQEIQKFLGVMYF
jgi:hypothetical protein